MPGAVEPLVAAVPEDFDQAFPFLLAHLDPHRHGPVRQVVHGDHRAAPPLTAVEQDAGGRSFQRRQAPPPELGTTFPVAVHRLG